MPLDQPKILFVVNPHAGRKDKSAFLNLLDGMEESLGFTHRIYFTTGSKKDEAELKQAISLFDPSIVAAVGGDGTCNLIAKTIHHSNMALGIIPFGSANGMATELNIPNYPAYALETMIKGKVKEIDLLEVNNHITLHLGDVGLNAKVIKRFEKENRRGILNYGKQLLRELFFIKSYKFEIKCDGNLIKRRSIMITFANASKYGSGAIINPAGKTDDGKFEICIIKPFPMSYILVLTFKFFSGSINNSKYVEVLSSTRAQIHCTKKLTLQLDGEIIGKFRNINIKMLPKSLKVMVPLSSINI